MKPFPFDTTSDVPTQQRGRFYTCQRHGWDAFNSACPKCMAGDAPRHCGKHGWSHTTKPCPACAAGR